VNRLAFRRRLGHGRSDALPQRRRDVVEVAGLIFVESAHVGREADERIVVAQLVEHSRISGDPFLYRLGREMWMELRHRGR
jgi:hypothetical protein